MEDTKLAARVYASSYVKETRDKRSGVSVRKKGGGSLTCDCGVWGKMEKEASELL